jgi:4-hydroxyphenylpyruvate dioxygenase
MWGSGGVSAQRGNETLRRPTGTTAVKQPWMPTASGCLRCATSVARTRGSSIATRSVARGGSTEIIGSADVFARVPNVAEDHAELARRSVLVDGDAHGYLLQIFTKNLIGPIFIELIQRNNHLAFGEGNFGALFRSIERDQVKRGYL